MIFIVRKIIIAYSNFELLPSFRQIELKKKMLCSFEVVRECENTVFDENAGMIAFE